MNEEMGVNVLVYGMQGKRGGGIEEVLMNYLRYRKSQINYIYMIPGINDSEYEDEIRSLGGQIEYFTPKGISVWKNIKDILYIYNKYDKSTIVYFNAGALYYAIPYFMAFLCGFRNIVVHAHNGKNYDRSRIIRCLHYFNRIWVNKIVKIRLSCSDLATDWIFGNKYADKTLIINNAVNVSRFKYNKFVRDEYRMKNGFENSLIIGNVGRICAQKNQLFALEIFYEILKKIPNAHFFLVGSRNNADPQILKELDDFVFDKKLKNNVHFIDVTNKIENIYSIIDILLFPSLYEGLGIVCIEAQISGAKVYVSDNRVPKTVDFTPNIKRIGLDRTASEWANFIIEEQKKQYERKSYDIEAKKSKYELENMIDDVEKIFFDRRIQNVC